VLVYFLFILVLYTVFIGLYVCVVEYGIMAKLIQPPQKFVTPEWYYGCQYLYGNTEAKRVAAERLLMESKRTIEDTKKTTERLLFENKKRTGEPVLLCWMNTTDIQVFLLVDKIIRNSRCNFIHVLTNLNVNPARSQGGLVGSIEPPPLCDPSAKSRKHCIA